MSEESALTFPCRFPVKVMGINSSRFEADIVMIVRKHVPDLSEGAVHSRPSSNASYLAVTVTFTARSRKQLDALYQELTAHPDVKFVL